jgi:hypothetical protein
MHATATFRWQKVATMMAKDPIDGADFLGLYVEVLNMCAGRYTLLAFQRLLALTEDEVYGRLCVWLIHNKLNRDLFMYSSKAQALMDYLKARLDFLRKSQETNSTPYQRAKESVRLLHGLGVEPVLLEVRKYLLAYPTMAELFEPEGCPKVVDDDELAS